jgi:hypothetical protein
LCERSRSACRRFAGAIRGGIGATGTNLDAGGEPTEREREDIVKLGARLANSEGFRVIALDGREVGWVENVLYERHTDHPDEVLVRKRYLFWDRYATLPFEQVANVDPEHERVYLALPHGEVAWGRERT